MLQCSGVFSSTCETLDLGDRYDVMILQGMLQCSQVSQYNGMMLSNPQPWSSPNQRLDDLRIKVPGKKFIKHTNYMKYIQKLTHLKGVPNLSMLSVLLTSVMTTIHSHIMHINSFYANIYQTILHALLSLLTEHVKI